MFGSSHFGHTKELCSKLENSKKLPQRATGYYTMSAQGVTIINLTTLHLDKVLSDLPLLMDPKQFAYQMKLTEENKA